VGGVRGLALSDIRSKTDSAVGSRSIGKLW
jgi:hypothetical protein